MNKKLKYAIFTLLPLCAIFLIIFSLLGSNMGVLNPKGTIGIKQLDLIIITTALMLIVVIPVFILTFYISRKFRESNKKAKYTPDWDQSHLIEALWWGVPFVIIVVLSIITWVSSHELDPYRPLDTKEKTLTIQVVALDWKWLFIYPEEKIATVNYVQFPEQTPVCFKIAADAPMNSFWIPQLGGQIFAMSGMETQLHLIANELGSYRGMSANLSGRGFAGMTFIAKATSQADYDDWVQTVKQSSNHLTRNEYLQLARQSENNPVALYSLKDEKLFDWIVMKYMMPPIDQDHSMHHH